MLAWATSLLGTSRASPRSLHFLFLHLLFILFTWKAFPPSLSHKLILTHPLECTRHLWKAVSKSLPPSMGEEPLLKAHRPPWACQESQHVNSSFPFLSYFLKHEFVLFTDCLLQPTELHDVRAQVFLWGGSGLIGVLFSNYLLDRSSLEKQILGVGFKCANPHVKNMYNKFFLQRVVLIYTATSNTTLCQVNHFPTTN